MDGYSMHGLHGEHIEKLGALEGRDSKFVKLVSNDNREFIIKREHAIMSETINNLFNGSEHFIENKTNRIHYQLIIGRTLEIVCKYFMFKDYYTKFPPKELPKFPVNKDDAIQLMLASSYLDC